MTRNEALRVFHEIPFYDVFMLDTKRTQELCDMTDKADFEEMIQNLMSLDAPVEDALAFMKGEIDFLTLDGKDTGDEWDYLEYSSKDGFSCWTEVLGITYYLKDMNIKWKARRW